MMKICWKEATKKKIKARRENQERLCKKKVKLEIIRQKSSIVDKLCPKIENSASSSNGGGGNNVLKMLKLFVNN